MASFTAAGTSYATHGEPMIPFYIFYSMFGFQRTGDLCWAFGDARGRGFMLGATAGRTTLNGEGLQHEDGHSHVLASAIPCIRAYDPAFAYEVAVIIRDGLKRMYVDGEDVFYYLTLYNQDYSMPAHARGRRGRHPARPLPLPARAGAAGEASRAAVRQRRDPAAGAARAGDPGREFGVAADVWSATSYQQLRNEALAVERWNRLHPGATPRVPYVTRVLRGRRRAR